MKKYLSLLILFVSLAGTASASPFYFVFGVENIIPQSTFKEINKQSLGFALQIQNRAFCNLWYGIRFDFSKLDSLENTLLGTNVFEKYLALSPEVRYVFLLSESHKIDDSFYLFANGLLTLSSISRRQQTDESNFGIGGSMGCGIGFGFQLFKLCWTLELNGQYSSPNFILKGSNRPKLTNFNFGLFMGVRL